MNSYYLMHGFEDGLIKQGSMKAKAKNFLARFSRAARGKSGITRRAVNKVKEVRSMFGKVEGSVGKPLKRSPRLYDMRGTYAQGVTRSGRVRGGGYRPGRISGKRTELRARPKTDMRGHYVA